MERAVFSLMSAVRLFSDENDFCFWHGKKGLSISPPPHSPAKEGEKGGSCLAMISTTSNTTNRICITLSQCMIRQEIATPDKKDTNIHRRNLTAMHTGAHTR
jgi:hypothetical protein